MFLFGLAQIGANRNKEPKMTASTLSIKDVRDALNPDSVSLKNGVFTIRRGFYYTNGFTADAYAAKVKAAFPTVRILDSGEVWKPFRGGASVAASSHWYVKFEIPSDKFEVAS